MTEASARPAIGPLDISQVMAALPHRYPMLLVDRVESLIPDRSIVAVKAVTINEGFFQGHFPGRPIMPGGSANWSICSNSTRWPIAR